MAKSKFTTCKTCGKEIAKTAKACPHCGAPVKKKFYQRVWFWFLFTVLAAGIFVYTYKDQFLDSHEVLGKAMNLYSKVAKKNKKKGFCLPWKK